MVVLTDPNSGNGQNETESLPLERLDRNQREITRLFTRLTSYVSEPKTYEQFITLNGLKRKSYELLDSNKELFQILRQEDGILAGVSTQLQHHLAEFQSFAEAVEEYLTDIRRQAKLSE